MILGEKDERKKERAQASGQEPGMDDCISFPHHIYVWLEERSLSALSVAVPVSAKFFYPTFGPRGFYVYVEYWTPCPPTFAMHDVETENVRSLSLKNE